MPGLPYLPPGQSELPAERYILFADTSNVVVRIDETATAKIAAAFTAEWQSPTLNQLREGFVYQLASLELLYAAIANTTLDISASGDGGENWSAPQSLAIPSTTLRVDRVRVDFVDPAVTGFDLRFRLQFVTTDLINVYGYRPHLVERGELLF